MHRRFALLSILAATALACRGDDGPTAPVVAPPAPVLLKEIDIPVLPSPYYHFDYDAGGRIAAVSFASGFTSYEVAYTGDRISELRNNALGNHDRLQYSYDAAGRVSAVVYLDSNGIAFAVVFMTYDGQRLVELERDRAVTGGFIVEKTMRFSYYPDGNLMDITEHFSAIEGRQTEATSVDHFEGYDSGINVDSFGLIHDEFFDHLVLLPGIQLQKNNPAREVRTGDGLNYSVVYTYTYDDRHRPLTSNGTLTIQSEPDVGRVIQTQSNFSYY